MKHIVISIISLPMLLLAACAQDEIGGINTQEPQESPRIVICGASASPGISSRAIDSEPSNFGVCNADKLKILTFRGTHIANEVLPKEIYYHSSSVISLNNRLNYRDKWTSNAASLMFSGGIRTGFAFPSVAYSYKDEDNFTFSCEANTNTDKKEQYDQLKLCVTATDTPEIFFGRLKPQNGEGYEFNYYKFHYENFDLKGTAYKYKDSAGEVHKYCALEGKLYRIVSQLNVSVSDVNPAVDKIEMYLSNVPTQIGLYAEHHTKLPTEKDEYKDHGFFYPVVAAEGEAQHTTASEESDGILVCTVSSSDIREGKARLSTFLLPSKTGRSVTIKAHFTDGTTKKSILRAGRDYELPLETSQVYYSNSPLRIYEAASNGFYSYSNVRVNVSGCFNDIFAQEDKTNVVIEICPNYDGVHSIEIN